MPVPVPEISRRARLHPYRQIAAWITASIRAGDFAPGDAIPSEKELMVLFGVGRTTARRTAAWLREQGWTETEPGRGSYVTDDPPA